MEWELHASDAATLDFSWRHAEEQPRRKRKYVPPPALQGEGWRRVRLRANASRTLDYRYCELPWTRGPTLRIVNDCAESYDWLFHRMLEWAEAVERVARRHLDEGLEDEPPLLLDPTCGSGWLPLLVKARLPRLRVMCTDVAAAALAEAKVRGGDALRVSKELGKAGAEAMAPYVREDTRLRTLVLRKTKLGVDGMRALAAALKTNTVVTALDVAENELKVEGAKVVAELIRWGV